MTCRSKRRLDVPELEILYRFVVEKSGRGTDGRGHIPV